MLLQHGQPQFRTAGLCIVDDIIEFCGPETQSLIPTFLPVLMEGLADEEASVRQCSAYGAGVLAEHGGDAFTSAVPQALELLGAMVVAENARDEENAGATDNAVKAIMQLCKFRGGTPGFDAEEVLVQVRTLCDTGVCFARLSRAGHRAWPVAHIVGCHALLLLSLTRISTPSSLPCHGRFDVPLDLSAVVAAVADRASVW